MKNSIIKKVFLKVLSFILIFTIVGCGGDQNLSSSAISEDILKLATFSEMKELSGNSLPTYFVFQDGNVKRFNVRVSATGTSADTLACFEVTGKEQRSTVISGISQYLTKLSSSFKATMGQEYQKVENRLLVEVDNFIILVICSDLTAVWEYLSEYGAKEVV